MFLLKPKRTVEDISTSIYRMHLKIQRIMLVGNTYFYVEIHYNRHFTQIDAIVWIRVYR